MWSSTVGLVNGKHRYLTAETFGFKVSANGQQLKRRQQWTIEPFPENTGPDGSISSAASVSSQAGLAPLGAAPAASTIAHNEPTTTGATPTLDGSNLQTMCVLNTLSCPSGQILGSGTRAVNGNATNGGGGGGWASSSSSTQSSSGQEPSGEEHENVAIKSHLNKYLAVDSFGNVTCDSDEKTENARFTITICSMSQGHSQEEHIFWALRNVERGYYLGTTEDGMLCCNSKMPTSRAELWNLHLLPARGASFFAIKSLGRKRFARVAYIRETTGDDDDDDKQQIQLDANISWGAQTLFQFKYHEVGKYSFMTSDNKLLTNEGKCIAWSSDGHSNGGEPSLPPPECLFTLEYHGGYLAFRDSFSQYLAAAGRSSVLRSRSIGVSREELFVFESVPIQVSLKATFNNRWVSIKQGVDLSANQEDASIKYETFQMTFHKQTQLWSIMTYDCNFWTISRGPSNTISVCRPGDYEGLTRGQFKLLWSPTDASFSMKFVDLTHQERWVSARKSGQLYLAASLSASGGGATGSTHEPVKFIMRFQNRRLLNLRPLHEGSGFVGLKSTSNMQLEGNKASPDSIEIEYCDPMEIVVPSMTNMPSSIAQLADNNGVGILVGNQREVANVFNVRLNNTRMGQGLLVEGNQQQPAIVEHEEEEAREDQLDEQGATTAQMIQPTQAQNHRQEADVDVNNNNVNRANGTSGPRVERSGVESASAPSVASIINSFSGPRSVAAANAAAAAAAQRQQAATENGTAKQSRAAAINSAVSKLASSFEHLAANSTGGAPAAVQPPAGAVNNNNNKQQTTPQSEQTKAKVDGPEIVLSEETKQISGQVDQVAQSECCYLKMRAANNKYLVKGESVSGGSGGDLSAPGGCSILCDATNKACAQAWILELRSHNSIAIRASDNNAYMQMGTNGTIFLSRCAPEEASLWEF